MLTTEAIDTLVAAKAIRPWIAPGVLNDRRGFYVTPNVAKALENPWPVRSGESREVFAAIRQDMLALIAVWQNGGQINARNDLKPMSPPPPGSDAVWELRATGAPPGARTIGLMPDRNIFVAVSVNPRNRLGGKGSPAWNALMSFASGQGATWFPTANLLRWPPGHRFDQQDLGFACDQF